LEKAVRGFEKMFLKVLPLAILLLAGAVRAADHVDSLATENDPLADLLDLYAFVEPFCLPGDGPGCEEKPGELILALTVHPFATGATQFSAGVDYHFYLENDSGVTSQIDCSFSPEQVVTCAGLNGLSVQARVGEVARNGDIRVFAGLRDDPFFFDREAFTDFESIGVGAFSPPGKDFYAGANVMALVLGIKISAIPPGSGFDTNIQKIWAVSERVAESGINGAISGSWYNLFQAGQGWVIEVVSSQSGPDQFVVYFYGYDNFGEQLWLFGSGPGIEGNTATVEVMRTSGIGFGGEYDPLSLTMEGVGTMTFTFRDCNSGTVAFTPAEGNWLAFTTDIVRLTSISSVDCRLFTDGQIDRVGRPLVSDLFIWEPMKDAYNAASDPDTWATDFEGEILAGIEELDLADGIAGNLYTGEAQELATMFVDDRLQIDLEKANCTEYGAIEMATLAARPIDSCGGRALFYDVVDDTLGLVVSGFETEVGDYVYVNDVGFLSEFPFLAAPQAINNVSEDILIRLQELTGIVVDEIQSSDPEKRVFQIDMEQAVDHNNPGGHRFTQRLYLHHVDESRPMLFSPGGYGTDERNELGGELKAMLQANFLSSSHRYWPGSEPDPLDFQYLTVAQAAADHHEIVVKFKEIYKGSWLSGGISKGGMTVVYHKRFYPNDVQAAVAIAAPFKFSTADERYPEFLSTIGTSQDRQKIKDFQRLALERRDSLIPMFEDWFPQNGFILAHDPDESFESKVISFQKEFWEQYTTSQIDQIPGNEATDQEILALLNQFDSFAGSSESALDLAAPYYYQAFTEEGLEANSTEHLEDLLKTDQVDILALFNSLLGINPVYDPAVMNDIYNWVINSGNNMIFLYGGNDPWTAGAVELTGATNAIKVINPGDNHSVFIGDLSPADRNLVISTLEQWLNVIIQ
jgi:hypothetical protein